MRVTFLFFLFYLGPIRFTLELMDFILDYMDFTLDYTGIHASDWPEAQSVQSREIALRWIKGDFGLGDVSTVNQGSLSDILVPLLQ